MVVMVSAQQAEFESPVEGRFGRSPWLVRVDTETQEWKAFPNPGAGQSGGAGVAAAQFVIDQQASVVISGDFGPNAANAFRAAKIEMRLFSDGIHSVKQAVEALQQGKLPLMN